MTQEILKDDRKITAYFLSGDKKQGEKVGKEGVTKIEAYGESGPYSYIAHLAIYKGDTIAFRTPALDKEIVYAS